MAFYSILRSPPHVIHVEDGENGGRIVQVAIARGFDENRIVSLVCELAEAVVDDKIHWEFTFSFDVFAIDDSVEQFRTQDRQTANAYIPMEIRGKIMGVVCECLKALTNDVKPTLVYWITKDRDLPEKGMKKYHMLRQVLQTIGYSPLRNGTDPHGRYCSIMHKNPR